MKYRQLIIKIILYHLLYLLPLQALAIEHDCQQVGKQLLKIITAESDALNKKQACIIGKYEIQINNLRKKYPKCFIRHQQFNLDNNNFVIDATPKCNQIKKLYQLLEKNILKQQSKNQKCELGRSVLLLKALIGDNIDCIHKKMPEIIDSNK